MTRAFLQIFRLNFIKAFYYNILSIPLFVFIIYSVFLVGYDIIHSKNIFLSKINLLFSKYYLLIIFSLFLSEIVNIYHNI